MEINVEELVDQITDQDFANASASFDSILQDKMTDALDAEKIKVSAEIYNDVDRDELDDIEAEIDVEENIEDE